MIKMIAGVYGLKVTRPDGTHHIKGMGVGDGSFSLAPEEEARLVSLGVARYVKSVGGMKPFGEMSVKELREIGKKHGLTFRIGMTKAEMAKSIEEKLANDTEEEGTDGGAGENAEGSADGSVPTFDATEAVK